MLERSRRDEKIQAPQTPENDWSPEKRARIEQARNEWEAFIRQQEAAAPQLEKFGSSSVANIISVGREGSPEYNLDKYTSFAIRKRKFDDKKIIWISFPGLNSAESGQWNFFLEGSASVPGGMDAIPREGTEFVFHGPTSIAGYTPEQHIQSMEEMLSSARLIKEKYPDYKIGIHCFSGGTAPGVYVANQLGLEQGRPIDKLILVAPGDSIAYGIFSTYATKELAADLLRRGITKDDYHKVIERYTQMHNIKALPGGRNLVVHAGTDDHLIEMKMQHGTNELVERLRRAGKDPVYTVHENRNHASIILSLLIEQRLGLDPYRLTTPMSIWENDSSFRDPELMGKVDEILSNYSEDELRDIGTYLSGKGRGAVREENMKALLSPQERAVVEGLIKKDILSFARKDLEKPAVLALLERSNDARGSVARFKDRFKAVENLSKIVSVMGTLDTKATNVEIGAMEQTIDVIAEIKKLGLPDDAYTVVIDGAFAVSSDEHLNIVVTPEFYGTLVASGWRETDSGALPPAGGEQHYRVHRTLNGEDFLALKKDTEMIAGIPVVNRVPHTQEDEAVEAVAA